MGRPERRPFGGGSGAARIRRRLALLAAMILEGCGSAGRVRIIRLGHGLSPSHTVHRAMLRMAELVERKSGGTLRIEVFPSQQLGTERECLELLQIGSLGMTKVSAAVLEAFAPAFEVYGVPYIFRDDAHRFAVLDGPIGREILRAGERAWLRGLCYYDAGWRSFYTVSRPVRRPEDLAGLKIRTQESPTAIRLVRALGGAATPIAWGELYTALQQGVVDGAENNPPSFHLSRHWEVCRYYTLDEHTAVPDVLLISTKVWDRLTDSERRWLQQAAEESAIEQRALWKEACEEAMAAVAAAGVEIIRPDKSVFAEKAKESDEAYRGRPDLHELIGRIRAAGDAGGGGR